MTPDVPLIAADGLVRRYRGRDGRSVTALAGVSLAVSAGHSVAVVGESGSGKSTLIRCLAALERPDAGTVRWGGVDVRTLRGAALRERRRDVQVIFQDPLASFNPRFTVERVVAEPLENFRPGRWARATAVADMLAQVGLEPALAGRYPHELSGGQLQRVAIARALALSPRVLLCDEPLSSLDVSVQAQILALLHHLRQRDGVSLVFVTHNLALVPHIADRAAIMHAGAIVEELPADRLGEARHPYARRLLDALPDLDRARRAAGNRAH